MTTPLLRTLALALTLMAAACTPPEETPPAEPSPSGTPSARPGHPLAATLQVEPAGDSVRLAFSVTNVTEAPLPLTFPTGQSVDFSVHRGAEELWRWSANRFFTQAVREESLAPGETKVYTAVWRPAAGQGGTLEARAELKDDTHRPGPSTRFTLP